jgi:hypothetical protein
VDGVQSLDHRVLLVRLEFGMMGEVMNDEEVA